MVLLMNKIRVGGGHRLDFVTHMQLGVVTKQRVRIGYVYEFPMEGYSYNLPGLIHEFRAVFDLFRGNEPDDSRPAVIWKNQYVIIL